MTGDLHRRRLAGLGIEPPSACAVRDDPDYAAAADRAYSEGRREQRCPDCSTTEAGGGACGFCFHPMHPDEWVARAMSDAQVASRKARSGQPVHAAPRKAPRTPERPPHPRRAPCPAPAGVLDPAAGFWPVADQREGAAT